MTDPLRLVIFDVDGTLVDSKVSILASMRHTFEAAGLPVPSREAALGIVGLSLPEAMAVLAPDQSKAVQMQLADEYKRGPALHRENGAAVNAAPLFPGALETIAALDDAGVLLSAATGKSRRGLNRFLETHSLERMFMGTQTADDAPSKPHPQMILNCLAATGVDAENTVMIGDTEFDMEMGRSAGCHTIGVTWGYHPVERVQRGGAHHIINDFCELDGILRQIWPNDGLSEP
ncbi:MAG: HAD-IA family hydrolase [Pseudomonadota bacterium]